MLLTTLLNQGEGRESAAQINIFLFGFFPFFLRLDPPDQGLTCEKGVVRLGGLQIFQFSISLFS
jgi:hypothetical protein